MKSYTRKQKAVITYLFLSFLPLFAEPSEKASMTFTMIFMVCVIGNLAFAVFLAKRQKLV